MNNIQELLESTKAGDLNMNALCVAKFSLLGRTWMLTYREFITELLGNYPLRHKLSYLDFHFSQTCPLPTSVQCVVKFLLPRRISSAIWRKCISLWTLLTSQPSRPYLHQLVLRLASQQKPLLQTLLHPLCQPPPLLNLLVLLDVWWLMRGDDEVSPLIRRKARQRRINSIDPDFITRHVINVN